MAKPRKLGELMAAKQNRTKTERMVCSRHTMTGRLIGLVHSSSNPKIGASARSTALRTPVVNTTILQNSEARNQIDNNTN